MAKCQHDPLAPESTLEIGKTIFNEMYVRCRVCRCENHVRRRDGRPDREGGRTHRPVVILADPTPAGDA